MIGKMIRSFFGCGPNVPDIPNPPSIPDPEPTPKYDIEDANSKKLIPKDLKPFIKKVYYKHFLQYIKNNHSDINSNDAWLEIKYSIDNYLEETMDAIADAIDSYIGWMESDIDDYAEGIFESWAFEGKSVRNTQVPENPFPEPPHAESCLCKDCRTSKEDPNPCAGSSCDIQPHAKMCQCKECQQLRLVLQEDDKEETLVDWEDADKAW